MTITCIVPFFNERDRILKVMDEVVKIKGITQIIVVDDGSTDGTTKQVKEHYPNFTVIHNKKNLGKSDAIVAGLTKADGNYILLLDADLQNLVYKEIENGIAAIKKDKNIDMIIFNRINAPLLVKLSRGAILTCGQRIIKKEYLLQTLSLYKPKGYEIEFALNQYMMDKQKQVYWMPITASNTKSTKKRGFRKGIKKIVKMHMDIFGYLGLYNALKQVLFFCKTEYTTNHYK